jgi:Protein of unknown function (DUF2911)
MKLQALSAAALLLALPAFAQQLDLPKPSLAAKVSQVAGVTEISLEYSSPAVRGRDVFGSVVPFGEVWRSGANSCTKITFSKEVQIGGRSVPAGTYCLFTVPRKDKWTFIINKDATQWGAFQYKDSLDVARMEVTPEAIPPRERLVYIFSGASDDGVRLDLEWDRTRASLPIRLGTAAQAASAIAGLERSGWRPYNSAAQWELQRKDYATGLRLVETSLKLHEDPSNLWTKAQLLAGNGQTRDARTVASRALELGKKDANFEARPEVEEALAKWGKER